MKTILLTQEKVAFVDDEEFAELNKYNWCADKIRYTWYACRVSNGKKIFMHRQILKSSVMIDHINHNGLDNRKINLRSCSPSQNLRNCKIPKNNTSGLIGVHWVERVQKWFAYISKNNKRYNLGYFSDKEIAGRTVDKKALELYGPFVTLNFPGDIHERA
jgi:hypothetical protein